MKTFVAIAVILAAAAAAPADMWIEITANPDPAPGLKSFDVSFRGDTLDDAVYIINSRFDGTLSQAWWQWKGQWRETPWEDDFILPFDQEARDRDSHLLIPHDAASVWIMRGVREDFDLGSSIPGPEFEYGVGSYLADTATTTMELIIRPGHVSTHLPFAQIVYPEGETVWLSGWAATWDNTKHFYNVEIVPEPASLALLAIGALGLIRKRQSHA